MELRLPNYTLEKFQEHTELFPAIETMLNMALENNLTFYEDKQKKRQAKAVILSMDERRYMVYRNKGLIQVFAEDIHEYNQDKPFQYDLSHLQKDEDIYTTCVLKYQPKSKDSKKVTINPEDKNLLELFKETLGSKFDNRVIEKLVGRLGEDFLAGLSHVITSPERAKQFFDDMSKLGLYQGTPLERVFFEDIGVRAAQFMKRYAKEIDLHFHYLNSQAKKHGFTAQNKFEFNDLDNTVFKHKQGFFMTSQNISWLVMPLEGDKNWDVYASSYEYKRHADHDSLAQAVKKGTIERLEDVSLQMRNGVVTYCNPADMYCFYLDMKYSAESIERDYGDEIKFDIDVKSYEYQTAYYQHRYNVDEASFICSAVLGLGTGFEYHPEKGLFYDSSVSFFDGMDDVKIKPLDAATLGMMAPVYLDKLQNVSYLNEQWEDAFTRFAQAVIEKQPHTVYPEDKGQTLQEAAKIMLQLAHENKIKRKQSVKRKI